MTPPAGPLRIFFVRHGESEANLLHVFSNRGVRHGLTERGRAQVEELASRLAAHAVTRIFCSPLLRATESAELLARRLGVEHEVVEALREYDVGTFEGSSDPAHWESFDEVTRGWLFDGRAELRTGGGESLDELTERLGAFVRGLPARFPAGGNVVLLSHGGLFRCALPALLQNVTGRYAYENLLDHVSWVLAEFRDGDLICREWSGTRAEPGAVLDLPARF